MSSHRGPTLVHLSVQRKRFWWYKGDLVGTVQGMLKAGKEGVLRRLGTQ
jgi:hypothetical protein